MRGSSARNDGARIPCVQRACKPTHIQSRTLTHTCTRTHSWYSLAHTHTAGQPGTHTQLDPLLNTSLTACTGTHLLLLQLARCRLLRSKLVRCRCLLRREGQVQPKAHHRNLQCVRPCVLVYVHCICARMCAETREELHLRPSLPVPTSPQDCCPPPSLMNWCESRSAHALARAQHARTARSPAARAPLRPPWPTPPRPSAPRA